MRAYSLLSLNLSSEDLRTPILTHNLPTLQFRPTVSLSCDFDPHSHCATMVHTRVYCKFVRNKPWTVGLSLVVTMSCFSELKLGDNFARLMKLIPLGGIVSPDERPKYRNRNGDVSTNVLATCGSDLRFIYVLPGWEGSAGDSRVLRDALRKYFLVDAVYTNGQGFLAPYRGTRYHLNEWIGNTPSKLQGVI
ncbi:hypothetical protein JHK87_000928 [Glycine soja]|nr:hypothetical protein JHK87_000928 [Glycine soja]